MRKSAVLGTVRDAPDAATRPARSLAKRERARRGAETLTLDRLIA